MLTANQILDRIIVLRGLKSDTALARMFGVKQNTVSTWRSRNTIPYDSIVELYNKEKISLDSLFADENNFARPKYFRIGERLKKLRGKRSQEDVSKGSSVALYRYQQYESGERLPDGREMIWLAGFFGVDRSHIFIQDEKASSPLNADEQDKINSQRLNLNTMKDVIEGVERIFKKNKLSLPPKKKATLIILLYQELLEDGTKRAVFEEKVVSIAKGLAV